MLAIAAVPLLALPLAPVQRDPAISPRVAEYRLDVRLNPARGTLAARADVSFAAPPAPGDHLTFYLHGELAVEAVESAGRPLDFEQEPVFYNFDYSLVANQVTIRSSGEVLVQVSVTYEGFFNPSRARSPSDYMRIDRDGVLLRSYGYSLWFPVFLEDRQDDHPVAFPEVTIRTPADFVPVFVGRWVGEQFEGEERVSRWAAADTPLFDAQLTARRYQRLRQGEGLFTYHLADEEAEGAARQVLAVVASLESAYRQRYRTSVDATQIHILQMPEYGDISSGNVVGLSSEVFLDVEADPYALLLLAHELVHPFVWMGVSRSDPLYAFAREGLPSYFHLPVLAALGREELVRRRLRTLEGRYLRGRETGQDRRGRALPPEKPLVQIPPDELGVYKDVFVLADRAPLFLEYLRRRMGEEQFAAFARDLTNREALGLDSFRRVILTHLPGAAEDVRIWLETTDFPDRFRLPPP